MASGPIGNSCTCRLPKGDGSVGQSPEDAILNPNTLQFELRPRTALGAWLCTVLATLMPDIGKHGSHIKPVTNIIKRLVRKVLPHRKKMYVQMIFGRTSAETLRSALEELGIGRGCTVFVHSSMSSLGYFRPGPEGLVALLSRMVGSEGTILMPSFPFTGSMQAYVGHSPRFDVRHTPSRSGLLTETFRRYPGVLRSLHPTHPVCALGERAEELIEGHEHTRSPCGPNSPFGRLADHDALVLRLGTGALTLHHHVQELVDFPNLFLPGYSSLECIDWSGRRVAVRTRVYRERIPQILYLGDNEDDKYTVHPSNYPLLYRGSREAKYREDPHRLPVLKQLLEIRSQFESRGALRSAAIRKCQIEVFSVRDYLDYALREIPPLLSRHRDRYDLSSLTALLKDGGYPP